MIKRQTKRQLKIILPGILVVTGALTVFLSLDKGELADTKPLASVSSTEKGQIAAYKQIPTVSTSSLATTQSQTVEQDEETERPFYEKELKARLVQVKDQFAEDIKYPPGSRPIRSQRELSKYLPNRSFTSSISTDLMAENAPSISLKPVRHRFFRGEKVEAEAEISGIDQGDFSSVSARLVANRNIIARPSAVVRSENNPHQYHLEFDAPPDSSWENLGSIMLVAEFDIEGEHHEIAAPIDYVNTVATLDRVGSAEVVQEYLHIPVYINTSQPGLHKVSGNLYDANTGRPLVHLSGQKEVLSDADYIPLKAHIAALKLLGHEGPYELRDIALVRKPSAPRYLTEHGLVKNASFAIAGFPFSDYKDVPYHDEEAQARLDFMTQIGSTN